MEATNQGVSIADRFNNLLSPEPQAEESQASDEVVDDQQQFEQEAAQETEFEEETEGVEDEGEPLDLSYLSQATGLSEDQFIFDEDGLYVRTKTDGEEGRAKFADLVKSYQYEGHLNKKDTALSEKIKQAEQRLSEIDEQAKAKLDRLDDTLRIAYSDLHHEASKVDWKDLEENDREEFLYQQNKFQQREAQIQGAYEGLQKERAELAEKEKEKKDERLKSSAERLSTLIPEWSDTSVAETERKVLMEYAKNSGFTEDDYKVLGNPMAVSTLRKAMMYDQLQTKKGKTMEKVRKAPRIAKPGTSSSKLDRDSAELKKARENIRKTGGKKGSMADYLMKKGIV